MREEIDINKTLSPGDMIELHFNSVGLTWVRAAQIAAIEYQLANEEHWEIIRSNLIGHKSVIFTVRVKSINPVIVTAAVIAAAIMGVGFVAWLTLDKVYQIVESPGGEIATVGLGALGIAAVIFVLLTVIGKK